MNRRTRFRTGIHAAGYHRRRGTVLIVVIVLLLIAITIAAEIVHTLVITSRQLAWDRRAMQAHRLAESGLRRARDRLAADPAYASETWSLALPAGEAKIEIKVTKDDRARVIESRSAFPAGSKTPVRATRTLRIPLETSRAGGRGAVGFSDFQNRPMAEDVAASLCTFLAPESRLVDAALAGGNDPGLWSWPGGWKVSGETAPHVEERFSRAPATRP